MSPDSNGRIKGIAVPDIPWAASGRPELRFDAEAHTYELNVNGVWVAVPSVTQVIKAAVPVPFSAGAWYGYKMGVEVAGEVVAVGLWSANDGADASVLYDLAKASRNPNTVLKQAGNRGTAVHDVIERWFNETEVPDPSDFEPEDRKRISGLAKWLGENQPEPIHIEQKTASVEHLYAGTLDAFVRFQAGDHAGKTARLDWKTSKSVYPDQHFPQLEAYEQAEVEAGEEASDFRAVVHIPDSGRVKLHPSVDSFADFKVLLDAYRAAEARKARLKAAKNG